VLQAIVAIAAAGVPKSEVKTAGQSTKNIPFSDV
jgi:hypothetical protein